MCFSIPAKVTGVRGKTALIEGGATVRLGADIQVQKGDFVQVLGNIAVSKLSRAQGIKVRRLIARLNTPYE